MPSNVSGGDQSYGNAPISGYNTYQQQPQVSGWPLSWTENMVVDYSVVAVANNVKNMTLCWFLVFLLL